MSEEVQIPIGNVLSTKCPGFHLIPTEALIRLANRFQLGIDKKGKGAWNALSDNQSCLTNKELILERIAHTIDHCLKLRDKIQNNKDLESDDDSGAISWAGAFFCCATKEFIEDKIDKGLLERGWECPPPMKKEDKALKEWFEKLPTTKTLPKSTRDWTSEYIKEIEMDHGYFLFNTVTLRIFGTQCYESIEQAKEAIQKLEEKWKDQPMNRRSLEVVKVNFTDVLQIDKEDPRDESEKAFDKADEQSRIYEGLKDIKEGNLVSHKEVGEAIGIHTPPIEGDGSMINPFKKDSGFIHPQR